MDTVRHSEYMGDTGYRWITDSGGYWIQMILDKWGYQIHGGYWIQVDNGYRGILDTDDTR